MLFRSVSQSRYSGQTQVWAKSFAGSGAGDDWGVDVQLAASGKVIVAGFVDADATAGVSTDFITLGYDAAGASLFSYNPGGVGDDNARCVAFRPSEEIWAAGEMSTMSGSIMNKNATLYKITNSGSATSFSFDGQGDKSDNVKAWFIDAQQNVYMAGYSVNRDTDRDFSLVRSIVTGKQIGRAHV